MSAQGAFVAALLWGASVFAQDGSGDPARARLERQLAGLVAELEAVQSDTSGERELDLRGRIGSLQQDLELLGPARESYERAVELALELGQREKLLVHLGNLAIVVSALGEVPLALDYGTEALALAQELDRPQWVWSLANNNGTMHLQQGDYAAAASDFTLALEARPDDEDPYSLGMVLSNLAVAHMYLGDHDQALELLDRALPLMEEAGSMTGVAAVLSNQGDVHHLLGDNELALTLQQDALALREQHGTEADVANSLQSLGAVLAQLGRGEEALQALDQAIEIERRLGLKVELVGTLSTLAEVEAALGQGEAAERAALEGLELSGSLELKSRRLANLESLAEAYAAQGNAEEALRVEREARLLERALAGEEVREAFAASQAELEDQLRERELALLRKDSELRRQERTTFAIAAAALLLLALVGWGFFLSKRRILRRLDRALDELGKAQRSAARHGQELERALQEVGELQDDRLRAARLESIGLMAAGIAHDFNNLLTAFLGNVTLARESLRDRPGQRELLDRAVVAVDQASRLADQLLTLSKGGETRRELVDLAALVREAATFAASGSSAGLRLELADDLWPAEVDPGQISQVLGNLVLNALQATPEAGTVVVSARNLPAADGLPSERGDDPRVEIRVTDSGPGVPEELHDRVFDPYFTTKSSGTGLGLTTAKAIVERHQGSMRLESGSEGGASFVVELPATPQHSSEEETSTAGRDLGQLRVLAVEDDPLVRRMYSSVFETIGIEAELAGSGAEALQLYRSAREAGRGFEVVLLDLSLPGGKDGAMVLEDLRRIDAGVRAVVTSGYTHAPEMVDYRRAGFAAALAKPFSIQGVKRALRAALHG